MSGVAFTTISPSSTNSRRSTPCVDGCCGHIEIVICVSSGRSTISNCGGIAAELINPLQSVFIRGNPCTQIHTYEYGSFQTVRLVSAERKILPQRMALPIVREKNPSQI